MTRDIQLDRQGLPVVVETRNSFEVDKVCNYQIQAPEGAQDGDLIYVKIGQLTDVELLTAFGVSATEPMTAICWIGLGDAILARYPDQIFLSVIGASSRANIQIRAFYAAKVVREDIYIRNFDMCSDKGASLSDLHDKDGWLKPELPDNINDNEMDDEEDTQEDKPKFDDVFEIIANFQFGIASQSVRSKIQYNSERRILS